MSVNPESRSDHRPVDGALRPGVVLVTGASRGLGKAIALACAKRNARVALLARSSEALDAVASGVRQAGGEAQCWPVDVRNLPSVQRAVEGIVARWSRIDVLVNVAGIKPVGSVEETPRAEVMESLEVNYVGPLAMCQAVLPVMRRHGRGHIINVSSVLGKRATPQRGVYAASKAALNALTEALRVEVAGAGIDVTLVCPGRVADTSQGAAGWLEMTVARAAERIVDCMERPRRELVLTTAGRMLVGLNNWSPALVDRIVGGWRRKERVRPATPHHAG